jgi:hypothetical protein
VGKVTFKSNGDEGLSEEFLLKSNGDEALNCLLRTFYAASSEDAYSFCYEAVLWL